MSPANQRASADFARRQYYIVHRQVRLSNLGSVAMRVRGDLYAWLFANVFETRFPRIGDDRHALNRVRSYDSLRCGVKFRLWVRLATGRRAA